MRLIQIHVLLSTQVHIADIRTSSSSSKHVNIRVFFFCEVKLKHTCLKRESEVSRLGVFDGGHDWAVSELAAVTDTDQR